MVSDRVAGIEGAYESLAEIGVTTMDRRGDLNLDEEKLREALSADPASVQVLFSHSSDDIVGVAERLAAFCDR
jgi:flagellar hook-associated protein 2